MPKLSISDLDLEGKRFFMRVDFNVPLDEDGRHRRHAHTRRAAKHPVRARHGARLILASHLGRPKGKPDPRYSLASAAAARRAAGQGGRACADSVGEEARAMVERLSRRVVMLENLRFHPGEEKNDPEFARQLAELADLYVNDAFGAAHRAHASTEGITHFVEKAAAGLLMEKELRYLGKALENPDRPFVVILGGAKVSDKIGVIENLLKTADPILIGGAMAYTFLKSQGVETGRSLVEDDKLELARELIERAQRGVDLLLPTDNVVVDKEAWDKDPELRHSRICAVDEIKPDEAGLDIGPRTIGILKVLAIAKTVVWNGPWACSSTSRLIAARARSPKPSRIVGTTIVGGGDSVAAITEAGVADQITHVSTGGGLPSNSSPGRLPGVEALTDK